MIEGDDDAYPFSEKLSILRILKDAEESGELPTNKFKMEVEDGAAPEGKNDP